MDIEVCGTCGSGSNSHLIVKCALCGDNEHCYCMKVVAWETPHEWDCVKCQYTNRGLKPSQGGQTELQRETSKLQHSQSNVLHQISLKSPSRFGNAKLKFISFEEVALLSRERPPFVRSRFAMSQPSKASSPPTAKHVSNMNCVSSSKSDAKEQALKQCVGPSHSQTKLEHRSYFAMQQRQVHPASPSNMKQPSNMKPISPGRSGMQVQSLKRSAATRHDQAKIDDSPHFAMRESQVHPASPHIKQFSNMKCTSSNRIATQVHSMKQHDQAKIDDINMDCETISDGRVPIIHECRTGEPVKVKIVSLNEHKARENKIVNADEGKIISQTELEPRKKGTLSASDENTGCKSEMGSLNQNKEVILSMGSTVEYSRRPAPANCWRGCFHVFYAGEKLNLGECEYKAYFPLKVSSRVYDIVKMMPTDLQLELLPRMHDWPKSFETMNPVHEDIGIDGENYLWGLFVRSKGKSGPWRSGSITT